MARRVDERMAAARAKHPPASALPLAPETFHRHRMAQAQRARTLGRLLVPLAADGSILLSRAPDVRAACADAFGPMRSPGADVHAVLPLRDLLGIIGAHEWRKKGVDVPVLGARIHPHYGVFAPVRGEYVTLVAEAPWPAGVAPDLAFDIGTGTGVLAAVLAHRGVPHVVASELDARAIACARDNVARLKLQDRVEVVQADLIPAGRAPLIVCNPPWVPGKPASRLEAAIFDPDSRMLRGFLEGLAAHLAPGGEGWLILSDLAVHLGLRAPGWLEAEVARCGLRVAGRVDARPSHPKSMDPKDPLHLARSREVTSLWRLAGG
ncbi:MAG: class I SAM-dependent methyltransferase, partial [Betaproteobacteria bacterium]|nr:class I SAM-dependent methyltransferase [Betaproteobacteria bacterium]